jgi:hypothetical protein
METKENLRNFEIFHISTTEIKWFKKKKIIIYANLKQFKRNLQLH